MTASRIVPTTPSAAKSIPEEKDVSAPANVPSGLVELPTDNHGDGAESSDGDAKSDIGELSMEGSKPALPAEPGTLKVSLLDTPGRGYYIQ